MPFQSEAQRRFMWAQHPEIARKWTQEGNGYIQALKRRMKNGPTQSAKTKEKQAER